MIFTPNHYFHQTNADLPDLWMSPRKGKIVRHPMSHVSRDSTGVKDVKLVRYSVEWFHDRHDFRSAVRDVEQGEVFLRLNHAGYFLSSRGDVVFIGAVFASIE